MRMDIICCFPLLCNTSIPFLSSDEGTAQIFGPDSLKSEEGLQSSQLCPIFSYKDPNPAEGLKPAIGMGSARVALVSLCFKICEEVRVRYSM